MGWANAFLTLVGAEQGNRLATYLGSVMVSGNAMVERSNNKTLAQFHLAITGYYLDDSVRLDLSNPPVLSWETKMGKTGKMPLQYEPSIYEYRGYCEEFWSASSPDIPTPNECAKMTIAWSPWLTDLGTGNEGNAWMDPAGLTIDFVNRESVWWYISPSALH